MIGSDVSFWKICLAGVGERDTKRELQPETIYKATLVPKREAQQPKWRREYGNGENREGS